MLALRSKTKTVRIFFATDIHGSDICWRKFLNAWRHYQADILVLGGDMTGKAVVPIVANNGCWFAYFLDVEHVFRDEQDVRNFMSRVANRGYYPIVVSESELQELKSDPTRRDLLFRDLMLRRVEEWMQLADERLRGTSVRCFVCPGNDDPFEIDEVIRRADCVELAEGRVVEFFDYQMVSTGWTNRTPWKTLREEDEEALGCRIRDMIGQLTAPSSRVIFNFHCPPYGSGLDEAPEVTEDWQPRYAGRATKSVGSKAVRAVIEQFQPLASLHGHIHEGRGATRIGRTLCVNPGSAYEQGQLLGALLDLDGRDTLSRYILTVG